jgi:hypothetical protein
MGIPGHQQQPLAKLKKQTLITLKARRFMTFLSGWVQFHETSNAAATSARCRIRAGISQCLPSSLAGQRLTDFQWN